MSNWKTTLGGVLTTLGALLSAGGGVYHTAGVILATVGPLVLGWAAADAKKTAIQPLDPKG